MNPETAPASYHITYEYGARGDLPPLKLTWYQGVDKPALLTEKKIPAWGNGVLFIGDKGMLLSDYGKHVLLPEAKFADFKRPEPFIPNSIGHWKEWIEACKTGEPTTCNFDYSGALTEANHLGNVAYRTGKKHRVGPGEAEGEELPRGGALASAANIARDGSWRERAGLQYLCGARTSAGAALVRPDGCSRPSIAVRGFGPAGKAAPEWDAFFQRDSGWIGADGNYLDSAHGGHDASGSSATRFVGKVKDGKRLETRA